MSLNVFQSSKSALIFAGSVILTTLVLVGPKEGSGVLGSVTENYSDERARIAEGAAAASHELSMLPEEPPAKPSAWEANPMIDHNLGVTPESALGTPGYRSGSSYGAQQALGNPATAPLSSEAVPVGAGGGDLPPAIAETPRGEAVVTSRFIKIEPQ